MFSITQPMIYIIQILFILVTFLFSQFLGVFVTKGDIGLGTILGTAMFNVFLAIGLCGVLAKSVSYCS